MSNRSDLVDALGTRHVPAGPEARIACFVPVSGKLRLIDGEYCSWYGPRAIAGVEYLTRFAASIS